MLEARTIAAPCSRCVGARAPSHPLILLPGPRALRRESPDQARAPEHRRAPVPAAMEGVRPRIRSYCCRAPARPAAGA